LAEVHKFAGGWIEAGHSLPVSSLATLIIVSLDRHELALPARITPLKDLSCRLTYAGSFDNGTIIELA